MRYLIDYNKRTKLHEVFDFEKNKAEGAEPYRICQISIEAMDEIVGQFIAGELKVQKDFVNGKRP